MRPSRRIPFWCCAVLIISMAGCAPGLPQPPTAPLSSGPTPAPVAEAPASPPTLAAFDSPLAVAATPERSPTLAAFDSPVQIADTPVPPPTLPPVRPSDTPDPARTPLIIAGATIGDDGHEVVLVKNISAKKLDLSSHLLYNPLTGQRFIFPAGVALASGETVEVHSGTGKEMSEGGLFWTEESVWKGENEDILLLNPTGRLIYWYVFQH
jgi:hypothetical protein